MQARTKFTKQGLDDEKVHAACVPHVTPPLIYINSECNSPTHRAAKEERCTQHAGAGAGNGVDVRPEVRDGRPMPRAAGREGGRVCSYPTANIRDGRPVPRAAK